MTRWLIALMLPGFFISHLALATANAHSNSLPETRQDCELDLSVEFSHTPDDNDQGFITRNVPITTESIRRAYARGIFPWAVTAEGKGVWYSPPVRGVLDITDVDIPRSDRKAIRRLVDSGKYTVKFDTAFREVITECAMQQRRIRKEKPDGTVVYVDDHRWITEQHIEMFSKLNELGLAHSVEVWDGDVLVGGLYGVFVNGYFSGESMFHHRDDVTKLAYSELIKRLKANGHTRIDIQQNVGINQRWGGKLIYRGDWHTHKPPTLPVKLPKGTVVDANEAPFLQWLDEVKKENRPY